MGQKWADRDLFHCCSDGFSILEWKQNEYKMYNENVNPISIKEYFRWGANDIYSHSEWHCHSCSFKLFQSPVAWAGLYNMKMFGSVSGNVSYFHVLNHCIWGKLYFVIILPLHYCKCRRYSVDRILAPCNYCHHPWCVGHKSYHKALLIMFGCDGISEHATWNEVFH